MQRWFGVGLLVCALVGLSSFVLSAAGKSPTGSFQPFTVEVTKEQPVALTLAVPVDGKTVTATVPLTIGVDLQIQVSGVGSASVVLLDAKPATAQVAVDDMEVDDLGIPFDIKTGENIEIVEWTVYESDGMLNVIGKLKNTSADQQFSLADFTLKFYDEKGKLIGAATPNAGGRWVRPSDSLSFDFVNLAPIKKFSRYEIELDGVDWMEAPQ